MLPVPPGNTSDSESVPDAPLQTDVVANDGPPGRVYMIALDQMSGEHVLRIRHFLREFIDRHFGPNDAAAVVATTRGSRGSGHEFTSNPRLLIEAIDRFTGGDIMGPVQDRPVQSELGERWLREKNFSGDLLDLMRVFATVRGARKAMILVSQGLPRELDPYRLIGYRPSPLGGLFSDVNADFLSAMSFATHQGAEPLAGSFNDRAGRRSSPCACSCLARCRR